MKTIELKVYKFQELSKQAQQKAIETNRDINVDYEWWNCTYDDAENIGLEITGFNLDREGSISTNIIKPIDKIINTILAEHGKECQTYITAKSFEKQVRERDNKGLAQKESTISSFKYSLSLDYKEMLQKEYEYLIGDECIKESLEVNEYDFLETGLIY